MAREPHWAEQRFKDYFPQHLQKPSRPGSLNGTSPDPGMLPDGLDRYIAAAFKGVIADLRQATEGSRNQQLNIAAYRIGRFISGAGLDESIARVWLEDTARAIGLEGGETQRTIQSGLESGKADPFALDGLNDYREPEPATEVHTDFPEPVDWSVILSDTAPEIDWLIPDIIERGRLHALFAPSKTHKSLIVQYLCADLAQRQVVMYLDFENTTTDLRIRFRDMEYTPQALTNLKYWVFPPLSALDTVAGGAQLAYVVEKYRPSLVIIDTTSRVIQGGENDSDTFRALYRHSLQLLKARGIAVLRIDHAGKDVALGQRGSSAKGDDVDTVWLLIKHDDERFTLKCQLQRSGNHPEVINLRKHLDPLRFERLEAEESSGPLRVDAIIRELERLGCDSGMGYRSAFQLLKDAGKDVRRTVVQSALEEWRRRIEADALTLDLAGSAEEAGPSPGPKINSRDQQLPDRVPDRASDQLAVFPAHPPDRAPGPLPDRSDRGVPEEAGPPLGGAESPPMVRQSDPGSSDRPHRPDYVDRIERQAMEVFAKGGVRMRITDG